MEKYIIAFKGLSDGKHRFDFKVDKKFFANYPESEINDGKLNVGIDVVKKHDLIEFYFLIEGKLTVNCDRCLQPLDIDIYYHTELFVEFGNENSDISDVDNVLIISYDESEIDLTQHIYEYVMLSLPYQKIHPDDKEGYSTCAPEMLDYIEKLAEKAATQNEVDPRWAKLQDLKVN